MTDEQNQPITQDALEAAGYERVEYNNGALIEYRHTIKPLWPVGYRRRECCVRVRFPNDTLLGKRGKLGERGDFIVWVSLTDCMTAAPRVRTMQQLEQLLWLLTDGDNEAGA